MKNITVLGKCFLDHLYRASAVKIWFWDDAWILARAESLLKSHGPFHVQSRESAIPPEYRSLVHDAADL